MERHDRFLGPISSAQARPIYQFDRVCLALVLLAITASFMNAQDLEALRWKSRVVVIFAPAGSEDRLARQIQLFRASEAELRDRDVTQMVLRSSVENRKIADRFKLGQTGFTVVLIGKDGGGKFRSRDVVSAETLCRLIDSMPMRKEEMRERAGK